MRDDLDGWLKTAPKEEGLFYRGVPNVRMSVAPSSTEVEAVRKRRSTSWNDLQVGDTLNDPGFSSYSSSRRVASRFAMGNYNSNEQAIIVIKGKLAPLPYDDIKSNKTAFVESFKQEKEFMLPRNSTLRVTRISYVRKKYGDPSEPRETRFKRRVIFAEIVDSASPRIDAPEGGRGKPCGASHIPKQHKCSKNSGSLTAGNLKTAAKVALAAGVLAGGAYLVKRKFMSAEEWRKHPDNARNNPKLTEAEAQRIIDEAIAGGQVWEVQEKINARRRAERIAECGGGLGKIQAPAKFDAAIPRPRCQAGEGAFGTYFVHNSGKYGVKLYRDPDSDPDWEFERLGRAHAAGVNVPEPLRMNASRDADGETRAQTLILSHMKGYTEAAAAFGASSNLPDSAPLILKVKAAREFRKLHTEGLAHGDIHSGNIMVNTRSKRVAIVDFGYSTQLDDPRHRDHYRDGIENLRYDLQRLPRFLGLDPDDFLERNEGVINNITQQAENYSRNWEKFELGIKRYHDALETELLWDDRRPRSRFVSGADQPRIPGLTRRILTANLGTPARKRLELMAPQGKVSEFQAAAKNLGVKPGRLILALKPERAARLKPSRPIIRGRLTATPAPQSSPGANTKLKAQMYKHWSAGRWRWKTIPQKPAQ